MGKIAVLCVVVLMLLFGIKFLLKLISDAASNFATEIEKIMEGIEKKMT
jgi:hypothetical protein